MPLAPGTIFWGVDRATRETIHVSEIPPGDKSRCVCAACGQGLESRNSANPFRKATWHFRHVDEPAEPCDGGLLITALAAVVATLGKLTAITLPKRVAKATVTVGGRPIAGFAEHPEEDIQLETVRFENPFFAVSQLVDGRALCFFLVTPGQTGTTEIPDDAAVLRLAVDPQQLSALPPDELRQRIRHLGSDAWAVHWADDTLYVAAEADAEVREAQERESQERASRDAAQAYTRMLAREEAHRQRQREVAAGRPAAAFTEDPPPPRALPPAAPEPIYRWLPPNYLEPDAIKRALVIQQSIEPAVDWPRLVAQLDSLRPYPVFDVLEESARLLATRPGVVRDFLTRLGAIKFDEVGWQMLLQRAAISQRS